MVAASARDDEFLQTGRPWRLPLLEARAAQNRPPLRGLERHRRFASARCAGRGGLDPLARRSWCRPLSRALGLAGAASFWFVAKTLVGEKSLLTRRPDEPAPAVDALQSLVLELHWPAPKSPMLDRSRRPASGDNFRRLTQGGGGADTGPNDVLSGPCQRHRGHGGGSEPAPSPNPGVASCGSASGRASTAGSRTSLTCPSRHRSQSRTRNLPRNRHRSRMRTKDADGDVRTTICSWHVRGGRRPALGPWSRPDLSVARALDAVDVTPFPPPRFRGRPLQRNCRAQNSPRAGLRGGKAALR